MKSKKPIPFVYPTFPFRFSKRLQIARYVHIFQSFYLQLIVSVSNRMWMWIMNYEQSIFIAWLQFSAFYLMKELGIGQERTEEQWTVPCFHVYLCIIYSIYKKPSRTSWWNFLIGPGRFNQFECADYESNIKKCTTNFYLEYVSFEVWISRAR